jgi:hypothetical protein
VGLGASLNDYVLSWNEYENFGALQYTSMRILYYFWVGYTPTKEAFYAL